MNSKRCKYCTIEIEDAKILKKHEKLHVEMGDKKLAIPELEPEDNEESTWTPEERKELRELTKKASVEKKTRNKKEQKLIVTVVKEEPPPPKWDTINILQTKDGVWYVPCPHCGGALVINMNSETNTVEHMEVMSAFMDYLFRGSQNETNRVNS